MKNNLDERPPRNGMSGAGPPSKRDVPPLATGFPSPADDYLEGTLDLNCLLVRRPAATFFFRVEGHATGDEDLRPGDLLVVDRSLAPAGDRLVVAVAAGEFVIERLRPGTGRSEGFGETEKAAGGRDDLSVWGVVTAVIRRV